MTLMLFAGCAVPATFVIAGAVYVIGLELLEAFLVTADGDPVLQAARIDLEFPTQPTDQPASASFELDAQNIQAVPLDVSKIRPLLQSVDGHATIDVSVAGASESNPCTNGTPAGQFRFSFNGTDATLEQGSFVLPAPAFDHVRTGSFSLCLGTSANTDASISISEIGVAFARADASCPGGNCDPDPVTCVGGFCPFGQSCNLSNQCVTTECRGVVCALGLRCNDEQKCEPFPCEVDSVELCSGLGLTCTQGQCLPFPCVNNECHFGTGCNAFNQCDVIGCGPGFPCPPSLVCDQGLCVEHRCESDDECPANLRCDVDLCVPRQCESNFDCLNGREVCNSFGQCVPVQCGTDSQCPFATSCDVFIECVPLQCSKDDDCPYLTLCSAVPGSGQQGECRAIGCDRDGTCAGSNYRCEGASCVPYACQEDSDCPLGFQCNAFGECVSPACIEAQCPFGLQCHDDRGVCIPYPCFTSGCPSSFVCDETAKTCVARECTLDADCPSTLQCNEGRCLARACGTGSVCPSGTTCNAFQQCVPPETCAPGSKCQTTCVSDSDCTVGEFCVGGECGPNDDSCTPGVDCECNTSSDCPDDHICEAGLCITPGGNCIPGVNCDTECDFDSDCPDGLSCSDPHCCYDPDLVECAFSADCPEGKTCSCRYRCE